MTDNHSKQDRQDRQGHTPGPWEAALERGCHGVIAKILPDGGANFVCLVGNDKDTPYREPVRFANARLIASAPDMLEALRRLVKMIDEDQVPIPPDALYAALADARAAIRKATGETQ